jgi:rhodanese-related sulfurtransferase
LPDELARLREDATLALLDVRSTELHRAGGVEESAGVRFQDGEASPPEGRVEAEVRRTA